MRAVDRSRRGWWSPGVGIVWRVVGSGLEEHRLVDDDKLNIGSNVVHESTLGERGSKENV